MLSTASKPYSYLCASYWMKTSPFLVIYCSIVAPMTTSSKIVLEINLTVYLFFACLSSVRAEFEYHIMLSISQQFNLIDLLRKMLRKLKNSIPENHDLEDLINELKSSLSTRRYLIILDDVWKDDLWNRLKDALPDVKNGSRILMTSRSIDIAKSADPKMPPYELFFLDAQKSRDLLIKKALCYKEPDKECPCDLLEIANKLSNKCKGLPLALIVLGGILLNKECTYPIWNRVLQTLDWYTKGKDCMQILAMSYEDMPYHLKACFLYLAFFPEDYEVSTNRLIRMWVAEGFIPHEGRATMEEIAEDCLEELFRRLSFFPLFFFFLS